MFSKQLCCMSTWLKFADSQRVYYRWYFSYVSPLFAPFSRSFILVLHLTTIILLILWDSIIFTEAFQSYFCRPFCFLTIDLCRSCLHSIQSDLLCKQCFYIGFQRIFFFCDFFIFLRTAPLFRITYARLSPRVFSPFPFCIFYQMFLSCTSCLK